MLKQIAQTIQEYDTIIIHRHLSPDPDALGSAFGLKAMINETYPSKDVYCCGMIPEQLKYIGEEDIVHDEDYQDALVIILDTPNASRVDDKRFSKGSYSIKIDHHPDGENFTSMQWVEDKYSSTSEMILKLLFEMNFKCSMKGYEAILSGIVADTNRFLYPSTSNQTFEYMMKLKDLDVDFLSVYDNLYRRSLQDISLFAYIVANLVVDKKVAYIYLSQSLEDQFDISSASSMIGQLNNIDEFIVWVFITEDKKQEQLRVNIRSRGPVINDVAGMHGGGGHMMASGIRLPLDYDYIKIIQDLQKRVEEYDNM